MDENLAETEQAVELIPADTMLARFYVYCLFMMLMTSARHLAMQWRFASDLMHHCLYYDVTDDLPDYDDGWHGLSQIIPYCIRPESIEHLPSIPSSIEGTSHSFDELHRDGVPSEQLYKWSASFDLAECYQLYLDNQSDLLCQQVLYNCTRIMVWRVLSISLRRRYVSRWHCQVFVSLEKPSIRWCVPGD